MNRHLRSALLFAGLAASAGASWSQAIPDATTAWNPSSTDMASQFLDVLLGRAQENSSTSVSALAAGMRLFNMAALSFGTLLFTYMVVVGTMRSAEDGELLGKKWSSMWIPLRFVMGAALMVPLGSGFSTAQHGMIWLAKAGSGIASSVWSESADYMASGGDRMSAQSNRPQYAQALDAAMRNVLKAEICTAAFRDRYQLGSDFSLQIAPQEDGSYLARWGYHPAGEPQHSWGPRECGQVSTSSYLPMNARPLTVVDDTGYSTEIMVGRRIDTAPMRQVIIAQATSLDRAAAILRPLATEIAAPCGANGQPTCQSEAVMVAKIDRAIKTASDLYLASVQPAIRALYASSVNGQALSQSTKDSGWVMAGSVMFTMARLQTEIAKLEDWAPNVSPPAGDESTPRGVTGGDDIVSVSWMNSMITKSQNDVAKGVGRSTAQWLAYKLGGDPTNKTHILVQIKDAGDYIMGGIQTLIAGAGLFSLWGGGAAFSGALKTVSVLPGIGSMLSGLGDALGVGVLVLFICGVVMSLVIPLMPFVLWAGSVLGWLVAVLQAIIAAPIWLAAHLHPEGDDITGKGANGYMILVEVLLRPTFMILGLIAALALTDLMGRWVGYAFFAAVDSVQADSMTGVFSILTIVVIYTGLTFTILKTCFGLVHDVPSTIMTWIGGSHATHDKGAEFASAAQGQINNGLARAEAPMIAVAGRMVGRREGAAAAKRQAATNSDSGDTPPSHTA